MAHYFLGPVILFQMREIKEARLNMEIKMKKNNQNSGKEK